ncbi:2299_t:CDS:10 [Cetraspora pellucida]|uniref:2299_t:CDS:1 n=1 Tax=Cetraspora pellucida TaxID=1433469 RepID=A0A9N9GDF3_9GLOM|nr:2299_t:CDS:10 [Cetraspora pellucida]
MKSNTFLVKDVAPLSDRFQFVPIMFDYSQFTFLSNFFLALAESVYCFEQISTYTTVDISSSSAVPNNVIQNNGISLSSEDLLDSNSGEIGLDDDILSFPMNTLASDTTVLNNSISSSSVVPNDGISSSSADLLNSNSVEMVLDDNTLSSPMNTLASDFDVMALGDITTLSSISSSSVVPNNGISSSSMVPTNDDISSSSADILDPSKHFHMSIDDNTLSSSKDTLTSDFGAMVLGDNTTLSNPTATPNYNIVSSPTAMDPIHDFRPTFSPFTKRHTMPSRRKPYKCDDCEKAYRHPHELEDHRNYKHGGENPNKCLIEGCKSFKKSLSGRNSLRRHNLKFHEGNPYPMLKGRRNTYPI